MGTENPGKSPEDVRVVFTQEVAHLANLGKHLDAILQRAENTRRLQLRESRRTVSPQFLLRAVAVIRLRISSNEPTNQISLATRNALGGSPRCQRVHMLCDAMKTKRNVKIAVLYTTYLPLPTNDWYNDWIKPFQSQIRTKMKSCASSPELYLEVSPSGGINGIADALEDLFKKAVSGVRLTQ